MHTIRLLACKGLRQLQGYLLGMIFEKRKLGGQLSRRSSRILRRPSEAPVSENARGLRHRTWLHRGKRRRSWWLWRSHTDSGHRRTRNPP